MKSGYPIELLIVDDDQGDIDLALELLQESKYPLHIQAVTDGEKAIQYLLQQPPFENAVRPHIVLLDLNLPRKHGFEVLNVVKQDPYLKSIPVIILSTSALDKDILKSYALGANCYLTKPMDYNGFVQVIRSLDNFWFSSVQLPQDE